MALLGDGFPADKRRAFAEKLLVPGCVIRIDVKFPEMTKPKLLVLVADDDSDYCLFIVNSTVNRYVAARSELARCQVKLDMSDHPFLKRDSYLACEKLLAKKANKACVPRPVARRAHPHTDGSGSWLNSPC